MTIAPLPAANFGTFVTPSPLMDGFLVGGAVDSKIVYYYHNTNNSYTRVADLKAPGYRGLYKTLIPYDLL